MPTTFPNIAPVRRVAVGDCSGPLGSGFDALARSAYNALLAAVWAEDDSAPFLPVHDNGQTANKTIPRGDAWKCTYGYDAAARTERSACGAVCYTFALPADATASGNVANIQTVSLSLTGDRYLDAGVDLYIVPGASATPPTVAQLLGDYAPVGTYCATGDQTEAPNNRVGVTETVDAALGVAAQPYLHVALLLHDYTTNRGAWIEGGAMLEGAAASVTFSRDVAADSRAVRLLRVTFDKGSSVSFAAGTWFSTGYKYLAPMSSAPPSSDICEVLRLAVAGRNIYQEQNSEIFLDDESNRGIWDAASNYSASGSRLRVWAASALYHAAPGIVRGMTIQATVAAGVSETGAGTSAGTMTVALVESAAELPDATGSTSIVSSNISPSSQPLAAVLANAGSVVAIARGVAIPATTGSNNPSVSVNLAVERAPSSKYLALVLVPETIGVGASLINGAAVLVAQ